MKYVFTQKRRKALARARRVWQGMAKTTRAHHMPGGKGRIKDRG